MRVKCNLKGFKCSVRVSLYNLSVLNTCLYLIEKDEVKLLRYYDLFEDRFAF